MMEYNATKSGVDILESLVGDQQGIGLWNYSSTWLTLIV
jgi:hypothetical protein